MEWLNLWLKKIILLVLLAAFLDLILPNTSMQRYVKMVMGLILLLTILSPVFSIFNLSQDELAYRLSRYQVEFQNATKTDWQPLAKKLMGQQSQQVTSYVKQQIENTIRMQVKETYGVEPEGVEVILTNENPDKPELEQIKLIMGEEKEDGKQAADAVQAVKPIEPVAIDLSRQQAESKTAAKPAQRRAEDEKMAQWLAQNWNIKDEQVAVIRDATGD